MLETIVSLLKSNNKQTSASASLSVKSDCLLAPGFSVFKFICLVTFVCNREGWIAFLVSKSLDIKINALSC